MLSAKQELQRHNKEKSHELATFLFPKKEWIHIESGIFVAKTRINGNYKERAKFFKEISNIRILTSLGSVTYFLPEQSNEKIKGKKYADAVLDGMIIEIKSISGNRTTLGKSFKKGYKQRLSLLENYNIPNKEHSVFLRLFTPFTVESVRAKIAGELKNTADKGYCICYFEATEELFSWSYDELRSILKK